MPARNLTSLDTTNMQNTEPRRMGQSCMLKPRSRDMAGKARRSASGRTEQALGILIGNNNSPLEGD